MGWRICQASGFVGPDYLIDLANSLAAKAINPSRRAQQGDGTHKIGLDQVVETMRQTGLDVRSKYEETSRGGLAVNVVECWGQAHPHGTGSVSNRGGRRVTVEPATQIRGYEGVVAQVRVGAQYPSDLVALTRTKALVWVETPDTVEESLPP